MLFSFVSVAIFESGLDLSVTDVVICVLAATLTGMVTPFLEAGYAHVFGTPGLAHEYVTVEGLLVEVAKGADDSGLK